MAPPSPRLRTTSNCRATTVYRILETLSEAGFIFRDSADDRYRLTARVRDLSEGFADEAWVTQLAKPHIDALCRDVVWPVSIATVAGTAMVLRETTDHATPLAVERYSAGFRSAMLATATGRSYLAHCPVTERDTLLDALAKSNKEDDKPARGPRPELLHLLAEIQAQGYATISRTRRLVEETSLAVPVSAGDRLVAVLTVRFLATNLPLTAALERFLPPATRMRG